MNEFGIIKKYFQQSPVNRSDVLLSSGDDCALLNVPPNQLLAVSIDTLISGVHFPVDFSPYDIGYKSLAVNLSDLAAMCAEPAWFVCALTLPNNDEAWLREFSNGLLDCAKKYKIQLVGGDLTRGNRLSITITVHGTVPEKQAVKRSGAKVGDYIYVSGKLGKAFAKKYYYRPEPKVELGLALRGKIHSAIDISDGLIADLGHILESSHVGARLFLDEIPLECEEGLTSGDDYELCFTGPEDLIIEGHKIYPVGKIESEKGLRILKKDGGFLNIEKTGYRHF